MPTGGMEDFVEREERVHRQISTPDGRASLYVAFFRAATPADAQKAATLILHQAPPLATPEGAHLMDTSAIDTCLAAIDAFDAAAARWTTESHQ